MSIEFFRDTATEWDNLAHEYEECEREIRRLSERRERLKKSLIERVDGDCMIGGGLKVSRHTRKGAIDYSSYLKDNGIDSDYLDEFYRKPETEYWRIDFY